MAKRILLAEDEPVIQRLCKRLLTGAGYELVTCAGVQQALSVLREGPPPDLLITDLRMPDGHGLEVIREFRTRSPQGAVIIVTGSPMGEDHMRQVDDLGPHHFIGKPFETEVLLKTVQKALAP
jgi:two-component system nitrogen regulation response regulator GlnG